MPAGYTLHGNWHSGPTYKVGLALSLIGEPFAYRHVNLREGEQKRPEFLAKNRFGQVPCLEHGDVALCQSAAILEYLAEITGKLAGASPVERARAREWMFWSLDRLAPGIYRSRGIKLGMRQAGPDTTEMYAAEGKAGLGVLESHLAGRDFLVGDAPTIADVDAYGVVAYAEQGGFDVSAYPAVKAWTARVEALPGFGKAEAILPKESRG